MHSKFYSLFQATWIWHLGRKYVRLLEFVVLTETTHHFSIGLVYGLFPQRSEHGHAETESEGELKFTAWKTSFIAIHAQPPQCPGPKGSPTNPLRRALGTVGLDPHDSCQPGLCSYNKLRKNGSMAMVGGKEPRGCPERFGQWCCFGMCVWSDLEQQRHSTEQDNGKRQTIHSRKKKANMNQFIQFHMNPISDTNFILISFKKATASNLHCSPSMSLARDSCLWAVSGVARLTWDPDDRCSQAVEGLPEKIAAAWQPTSTSHFLLHDDLHAEWVNSIEAVFSIRNILFDFFRDELMRIHTQKIEQAYYI